MSHIHPCTLFTSFSRSFDLTTAFILRHPSAFTLEHERTHEHAGYLYVSIDSNMEYGIFNVRIWWFACDAHVGETGTMLSLTRVNSEGITPFTLPPRVGIEPTTKQFAQCDVLANVATAPTIRDRETRGKEFFGG